MLNYCKHYWTLAGDIFVNENENKNETYLQNENQIWIFRDVGTGEFLFPSLASK